MCLLRKAILFFPIDNCYIITRLPVTRLVKLSLNFELLVPEKVNQIFIRLTPF